MNSDNWFRHCKKRISTGWRARKAVLPAETGTSAAYFANLPHVWLALKPVAGRLGQGIDQTGA